MTTNTEGSTMLTAAHVISETRWDNKYEFIVAVAGDEHRDPVRLRFSVEAGGGSFLIDAIRAMPAPLTVVPLDRIRAILDQSIDADNGGTR